MLTWIPSRSATSATAIGLPASAKTALPVGGAFVLVNDHDPRHLREEFETDHAGSYRWEYLNREMRDWRIQVTKLARHPALR